MIPKPTDEDLAMDLEAEYAASDRDAIRRALIRRAAHNAEPTMFDRIAELVDTALIRLPDGDIRMLGSGAIIGWFE